MRWRVAAVVLSAFVLVAAVIEARSSASDSTPWWGVAILAVAGVILAIVEPAAQWLVDHFNEDKARTALIRKSTKFPIDDGRRLPRVQERTTDQLAPRNAIIAVDYLHRYAEDHILHRLAAHQRVLVHGHSMAGKSRTCAHLITSRYSHRELLQPIPREFGRLLKEYTPQNAIIWLDDLNDYLQAPELRDDWDSQLIANGNTIVATMRTSAYNVLTQTGEVKHPHAASLTRFRELDAVYPMEDLEGERQLLAGRMPDARSRDLVARHGLGEFLGGGYLAIERYQNCEPDRFPYRRPMVHAAVDWRRIGLDTIPRRTLVTLANQYPTTNSPHRSSEQPAQALQWATETIHEIVRLIDDHPETDQFRATDFMVDHLSGPGAAPVPDITWETALTLELSPTELYNLGVSAWYSNRVTTARTAWQTAIDSGHPDVALIAAFNLGVLEQQAGDLDAARRWYTFVIDSDPRDQAAMAAVNLGLLEQQVGNLAAARTAYQTAIDSGHPDVAPKAAFNLGLHEKQVGNIDAARTAWQTAIDCGHPDVAPMAAVNLGVLEEQVRNLDVARSWYTLAIDSGHRDQAALAAFNLGVLEQQAGNIAAARTAYQTAIDAGHPEVARLAIEACRSLDS